MHFKTRFFVAAMVPVMTMLVVLDVFLSQHTEREIKRTTRDTLNVLLSAAEDGLSAASPDNVPQFVKNLSSTSIRATLIAQDGSVLADSEVTDATSLPNHLDRPEIAEAFISGYGESVRYSTTLSAPLMYVARRISLSSGPVVLRLAIPIHRIDSENRQRRLFLGFSFAVALILIAFGVWLVSIPLSSKLRRLTNAALSLSEGSSKLKIEMHGNDEFATLARVLSRLAEVNKEALDRLESQNKRIRTFIEAMPEGVMGVGPDGQITMVNKALLEMAGFKGLPQVPADLFRSTDILKVIKNALTGREGTVEVELIHPRAMSLLVRAAPLSADGGAVVVVHDTTEIRRLHQVRRDFIANVSHELRNPIATIQAAAETLINLGDECMEDRMKLIETIARHAERMGTLVRDLLELARVESGQYPLRIEDVSIKPAIEAAVALIKEAAEQKQLIITIKVEQSDLSSRCDKNALATVLGNLLDNAVKYTRVGDRIEIRAYREEDLVKIEVADTGPGIPVAHLPRIFERFYRVDKGRSRELGGTGLGLAIVKHLVMAMSGTVYVKSSVNEGSIFTVCLPSTTEAKV